MVGERCGCGVVGRGVVELGEGVVGSGEGMVGLGVVELGDGHHHPTPPHPQVCNLGEGEGGGFMRA